MGAALPTDAINIVGGIAFLAFGAWTLRGDRLSDDDENAVQRSGRNAVLAVGTVFFVAELGDKERVIFQATLEKLVHRSQDQVLIFDLGPARGQQGQIVAAVGKPYRPQVRALVV